MIVGGVDTHNHTHYPAALDEHGRLLGHREFPAEDTGYADLLSWIAGFGSMAAIGVESTGSFGATLTRFLSAGVQATE
jgi:transposase